MSGTLGFPATLCPGIIQDTEVILSSQVLTLSLAEALKTFLQRFLLLSWERGHGYCVYLSNP